MVQTPGSMEPWKNCEAKKVLKSLIESDEVYMNMPEEELYELSPKLFHPYEKTRFISNVKNLKKVIKEEKRIVAFQEDALSKDRQSFPVRETTSWGYRPWHTSEAKELLRQDVQQKTHSSSMKPSELHQSRDEYKAFPLKVFRKHIYQEEYAQLGRSYWMNKKEEKNRHKREVQKCTKGKKKEPTTYNEMNVAQLRVELKKRNLKVSGNKQQLIERLEASIGDDVVQH